ncbi:signal recognition particle 19 kDa protein [Athalia rosae]|uniref:signal recognition particle 19 kDa protein n=1 Tax=Athalia rosae TaxID=37344 RepID=UPI002033D786|nr:signal recognition particle 19 kDa protein [Athalia rosae]
MKDVRRLFTDLSVLQMSIKRYQNISVNAVGNFLNLNHESRLSIRLELSTFERIDVTWSFDRRHLCFMMALAWSPDIKHSDLGRWVCIYPAYLNSKKTLAEGRKLAKDKCIENPTHQEIRDVLAAAGLKVGVENKLHPRERSKELLYRGRIRVHLKNDDGTPVQPNFPTRDSLLVYLGSTIPKLKSRQTRQTSSDQSSQQSSSSSKKGKGKGRR